MALQQSSGDPTSSQHGDDGPEQTTETAGFLRRIKKQWAKLELDWPTVLTMMKGALPPTIAVSMYQADTVASEFSTLGYLVGVVAILGFAILPRAKFIQMLILDVLAVCIAALLALLTVYSAVEARRHTSSASVSSAASNHFFGLLQVPYNSSASAVSGVWLFFQIYLVHTFRGKYPQFQFPVMIYAIFANVACTSAPQFTTMPIALSFVKRLLGGFLLGLGLAAGTSLFIFPKTTRSVVFKEMASYIASLRGALKAHAVYFETLEHEDMFGRAETFDETVEKIGEKGKVYSPEAQAIRVAMRQVTELHGKLHSDLTFAKREFAFGKLGPKDLKEIFDLLRQVMIPVVGLGFVVDIFQRLSDVNKWNEPIDGQSVDAILPNIVREHVVQEWNDLMKAVHDPFASMIETINEGLLHVSYVLELSKPAKQKPATGKRKQDEEAHPVAAAPGDERFAEDLDRRLQQFRIAKRIALQTWSEEKGIKLPSDFFEQSSSMIAEIVESPLTSDGMSRERSRRQLYLYLYMEQLLYATGQTVLRFVQFADERRAGGKLSKNHLIVPGAKNLVKWAASIFKAEDSHEDDNLGDVHTQNSILQLGEAYRRRKDPEHLPPETAFQRIGDKIRYIPGFLRSSESAYGFRVACATMTIAVVAFLQHTQTFFIKQRLVWSLIMVNLSMSPTSGQSIFSFVLRVLGTTIATVGCFLVWYVPDEKTAGVIVFLFIAVSCGFYVPIKMFRFRVVGMISIVTITIVVGYELQVREIGKAAATSNGQEYYPIYLLAPYRLAAVVGGIAVAFFWTFFPYPISEHSVLRQSLGASLYLLANYYSLIHETLAARIRGDEGDILLKGSAGRRLQKARNKVFSKQMLMLNGLRTYSGFLKWEVPIGGRFPKKQYDGIILCMENIVNYLSLLGYASDTMMRLDESDDADKSDIAWVRDFKRLINSASVTSHEITSLLCMFSASITNRQPLPPYLKTPKPYSFSRRLEELDRDILNIRHVAEPGFSAFAVLQVASRCIAGDMQQLMRDVKALVGELDFSFHAVSTADHSSSSPDASYSGQSSAASLAREKSE